MSLGDVLTALGPRGLRKTTDGWTARCPAHDDQHPSLSVSKGDDGRALLCCQRGCDNTEIVKELGLEMADLFDSKEGRRSEIAATYDYRDEKGTLLYQVVRFEPKTFRQRQPDGGGGWSWNMQGARRVLYRLPELLADDSEGTVFVVEGEKDADALAKLGLIATTNVGGAGKWRDEYNEYLRGRRVVVLPDNDSPGTDHAHRVAQALTGVTAAVGIVQLAGLPAKGDVSDWLRAGGTVQRLLELADAALVKAEPPKAFLPAPDRLDGEREERLEMGSRELSFGVKFLDDALGGILPRDLVIVGAKTGIGKTALATIAALHNCQKGRRVHYFALEAEEREIERRMKFQIIANEYYSTGVSRRRIRYQDWHRGKLDKELAAFEKHANNELQRVLCNLHTFYRYDSFTSGDFCKHLDAIKDETDLVILDHLHYVDTDDENENRGYKQTVKQIRDSVLRAGKPVIVVAHVRKGDRRYETLVPTVEDFHGSSDIPKIATKAVMLAPAYDMPNKQPYLWNTYMQIAKCRTDSSVTRYAALLIFNTLINTYENDYVLGRLADGGKTFQHLTGDETPQWAAGENA